MFHGYFSKDSLQRSIQFERGLIIQYLLDENINTNKGNGVSTVPCYKNAFFFFFFFTADREFDHPVFLEIKRGMFAANCARTRLRPIGY